MLNIINKNIRSASSSTCTINFSQISTALRTDSTGYILTLKFKIYSGGSWMEDSGSGYDETWARALQVTIGGVKYTTGDHLVRRKNPGGSFYTLSTGTGKFYIKRAGEANDRFFKYNTYEYEVTIYLPYSATTNIKPGSYATSLHVLDGNLQHVSNSWPFLFGTYPTSDTYIPISGTLSFYSPTLPGSPTSLKINGISTNQVSQIAGSKTLTCSWSVPSNSASVTGGITGYTIFYYKNNSYMYADTATTLSRTLTLTLNDGDVVKFAVRANSKYGSSASVYSATYTVDVPEPAPPEDPKLIAVYDGTGIKTGWPYVWNGSTFKKATEVWVRDGYNLNNIIRNGDFADGFTDWNPNRLILWTGDPTGNWMQVSAANSSWLTTLYSVRTADSLLITDFADVGDWLLYRVQIKTITGFNWQDTNTPSISICHNNASVYTITGPIANNVSFDIAVKIQLTSDMIESNTPYLFMLRLLCKSAQPNLQFRHAMIFNLTKDNAVSFSEANLKTYTTDYAENYSATTGWVQAIGQ